MEVLIVDNDTLRALGLRRLLCDGHPVDVDTISSDELSAERVGQYRLVFVSSELLASKPDIFMAHRAHTVVISTHPSTLKTLDPTLPAEKLADTLRNLVNEARSTASHLPARLSPREIDVLKLVAKGLINKEIADRLNISFNTVLTHRRNISTKLGIKSTSGLGVYALINGLIEP